MLLLKSYFRVICAAAFLMVLAAPAFAGLQGFSYYNPYTKEERNLSLKEVPTHLQNYRADMRANLLMLIRYAKQQNPDFKIMVHEGQDLLNKSLWEYSREGYNRARFNIDVEDDYFLFHRGYIDAEPEKGTDAYEYLHSIDTIVLNNIYCGTEKVGPIAKKHHLDLVTIEQCTDEDEMRRAKVASYADGRSSYIFSDLSKAFKTVGNYELVDDSAKNIYNFTDAQNILILDDDSLYDSREKLVNDLIKTNYDIIIMKPLFAHKQRFSTDDLRKLHFKKNGSKRLLIAEFSMAEAHPKEYYWLDEWRIGKPHWLVRSSFYSADGVIVKYWNIEWKKVISRYFKDLLNEGFDGVFFTDVENYRYFEQQNPLE